MRLLFILDPLSALKPHKDSSIAMMRAAQARGHEVWATTVGALSWRSDGGVVAEVLSLQLSDDDANWFFERLRTRQRLIDFSAVLMRKDPPFDMDYVTATWLLEQAEREGARIFNRPAALRDHSEKLALAEFARWAPPTLVASDAVEIGAFIDVSGDAILKPLDGMGGAGVFRVRADDPNRNAIIETLTVNGTRKAMAQRYVEAVSQGDKRILIVGGEPVPFCLARIAKPGETRANLAVGGTGVAQPLSLRDREIGEALGPVLAARGLLFIGLDVIGDFLTEINVTSPTCIVEIRQQTGFDVAEIFICALERQCAA